MEDFLKDEHGSEDARRESKPRPADFIGWKPVLSAIGIAAAVLLVLSAGIVCVFPDSGAATLIGRRLPFPVAVIGTNIVSSRDFERNVDSVRRFYDRNQDALHEAGIAMSFDGKDGDKLLAIKRKEILGKMIEDDLVMRIGRENGIVVSDDDLNQDVDRLLQEYGTKDDVTKRLADDYGWTLDDFKRIIVRPSLYSDGLREKFSQEIGDNAQAKQKIDAAQSALESGRSFESVAKEYSESDSAASGGDLGWVAISSITPVLAQTVKAQPIRAPTGVVESDDGYHIILVEERKTENDADMVHLRQILVRKASFFDWLLGKEKGYQVFIPARGIYWDRDTATVKMTDDALNQFEEKLRAQPNAILF